MATAMNQASTLPLSNLISFSLPKTSSLKTIPFLPLPSKPSNHYNLSLSIHQKGFFLGSKRTLLVIPHVSTQEEQQGEVLFKEETIEGEGVNWVGGESEGFGDPDGRLGEFEVGSGGGEAAVEGEYVPPPEEAKLFVANLGYDIDSEKLAETFEAAGVVEIAEVIYNRTTGQSRGFGFVTMSTVEEADKAVEMLNRYELNGRVLQVNKAAPRGTKVERPPRTIAPEFRVYIGNLPWDLDSEQLKEIFREHGTVVNARIVFDRETGRSRGFGFVAMSSEAEVHAAIEALNGQSINGRTVIVRVAEDRPRRLF